MPLIGLSATFIQINLGTNCLLPPDNKEKILKLCKIFWNINKWIKENQTCNWEHAF